MGTLFISLRIAKLKSHQSRFTADSNDLLKVIKSARIKKKKK